MNTYDIYPEQANPGIDMRDVYSTGSLTVRKEDFVAETVKVEGNEYLLLHYQKFLHTLSINRGVQASKARRSWTLLQVDTPKNMDEWRRHLNAANTQGGYIEYVKGRYDHIVFSRGADKHLEINQANAEQIAAAIHEAIKNGARWSEQVRD